jgi:hypothetical protein
MWPGWQNTDQQQDENDEENRRHDVESLALRCAVAFSTTL